MQLELESNGFEDLKFWNFVHDNILRSRHLQLHRLKDENIPLIVAMITIDTVDDIIVNDNSLNIKQLSILRILRWLRLSLEWQPIRRVFTLLMSSMVTTTRV